MILAIDQGTTGSNCLVFDEDAELVGQAYREFAQHFPHPGWVEHDPREIWQATLAVVATALAYRLFMRRDFTDLAYDGAGRRALVDPQRMAHAGGHEAQELVADGVTQGIVHALEVVEIEVKHCERSIVLLRQIDGARESIARLLAVR